MSEATRSITLAWPDEILDLRDQLQELRQPLYMAGGPVRDAYLRRQIRDIDLTVKANGLGIARKIANRIGGAYYPLDEARDVGRVVYTINGAQHSIDVSSFRAETLEGDLRSRDFTINALAVDLLGDLTLAYDPCDGFSDLQAKVLRQCLPHSIGDDPIRVLRAVRYSVQFGLKIEKGTLAALRHHAPELTNISPERIRDEWFKILELPRIKTACVIADRLGALNAVLPGVVFSAAEKDFALIVVDTLRHFYTAISPARTDETAAQFGLGMFVVSLDRYRAQLHSHLDFLWPNERPQFALLLLAGLLQKQSAYQINTYAAQFRLSNAEKTRLSLTVEAALMVEHINLEDSVSIHRFWKASGDAGIDGILLSLAVYLAEYGGNLGQDGWLRHLERAQFLFHAYFIEHDRYVTLPVLLTGDDLRSELGLSPGKLIGTILIALTEAQVQGLVKTREQALDLVRKIATSRSNGHHS
ncbi:MAG: CCA tRNA nucleotidyltransferase [Anaerolineae bacterium]|nr:CCA tRNA nucleotidyltransferase [Anaerolineae bacterium]